MQNFLTKKTQCNTTQKTELTVNSKEIHATIYLVFFIKVLQKENYDLETLNI